MSKKLADQIREATLALGPDSGKSNSQQIRELYPVLAQARAHRVPWLTLQKLLAGSGIVMSTRSLSTVLWRIKRELAQKDTALVAGAGTSVVKNLSREAASASTSPPSQPPPQKSAAQPVGDGLAALPKDFLVFNPAVNNP